MRELVMMRLAGSAGVLSFVAVTAASGVAAAAPPTKEECIEAHGRGQDAREEGKLSRARQLFLTCGQSTCPPLVQADCSRFADELSKVTPTVSFAARDTRGNDIPTAQVYVDDTLVATRLDDGKSYDLDPGRHTVRFVHDGRETTMRVVLNQGEKGRNVIGTFEEPTAPEKPAATAPVADEHREPRRSALPLVLAGVGGAAMVTGVVLMLVGSGKIPSNCSMSSHDCAAPPGDKAFDDARKGTSLINVGIGVGIAGAVVTAGALVWYFAQPKKIEQARAAMTGDGFSVTF